MKIIISETQLKKIVVNESENIEKEGADLAELNRILVEKVEELTLYIIEQNTKIEALEEQKAIIAELIKEINILKSKF